MSQEQKQSHDPMGDNIIHTLLVTTNRWQALPPMIVGLVLLFLAAVVYAFWRWSAAAAIVAVVFALSSFADWFLLWLLPHAGRSYGPDQPPALALSAVRALLMVIMGFLTLPWWGAVAFNIALTLVGAYTTWIEPFRLGVSRERYTFDGWQNTQPPLRLLHIADLHIERITPRERHLNQLINELKPDVIVFSGDFVNISYNDDPQAKAAIRQVIGAWSAPLGVYCVPGTYTVEPLPKVREFVAGLDNLRLLEDEWIALDTPAGKLNILGMITTHYVDRDRATVQAMADFAPDGGLRLLLTHAPDVAPEADIAGYHLYLCGHTHGGQLRFPLIGAVFSGSALGMRFVMGRYDLDSVTVYTSRGVGLEGLGAPRARFLCPPEVILWEIHGTKPA